MGRLKFTKNGMSVDLVFQELAELYHEFFDADEYTNSADQLERIIDVLDEIKPIEINPFSDDILEAITYLSNDIAERFFEIPQAKPTFADKAEQRKGAEDELYSFLTSTSEAMEKTIVEAKAFGVDETIFD